MTTTTHDRPSAPAASGKAVLEATGVIMRFGGLTAVNNVNLRVNEGEIVGLIGPTGPWSRRGWLAPSRTSASSPT